tara:strand:- start:331 stop:495 length:165 start_codon:yes stop_codon:yes gene_type:complete
MTALVGSLAASCVSQKNLANEYKQKTIDVNRDNPVEVTLAQHLYNEMKPLKSND